MFQERLVRQEVHVYTHIDPDCSPVLADSDQMNQVLINLIMNAIHAMTNGGSLRIALRQSDDMAKLTIADTGQRIRQGNWSWLDGGQRDHRRASCSITVESEEGKGTTFTIFLPTSV